MCTNKFLIKNPVKFVNRTGFDKVRLRVPCNKCLDCLKQRSNDWLFRAYWEMQNYIGVPFFCTVTYDDEHLPSFEGRPCFDYEDVKAFFKRLRYYIGEFRYLLSCEYGGFLHRPHYHFLLFPVRNVSFQVFQNAVSQCWQCGIINKVSEVSSSSGFSRLDAVTYITGYCTKDVAFDSFMYDLEIPYRYRSRTQASKNFGAHDFSREEFECGYVFLPLGKNGISYRFKIPKYYYMKVFYDYSYDPSTRKSSLARNAAGVELLKLQHNRCYDYLFKSVFSTSIPHDISFHMFPTKYFSSWAQCLSFISEDTDDFAEFLWIRDFLVYRDKPFKTSFDGNCSYHYQEKSFSDVSYSYLTGRFFTYYRKSFLKLRSSLDYFGSTLSDDIVYRPRWKYYLDIMQVYDEFHAMIDRAKTDIGKAEMVSNARKRAIEKLKNDRQLFNFLRFVKGYDFEKNLGVKFF